MGSCRGDEYTRNDGITVKSYKCDMWKCGCTYVSRVILDKEFQTAQIQEAGHHDHTGYKETLCRTAAQKGFVKGLIAGFTKPDRVHLLILKNHPELSPYPTIDVIRGYNRNHGKQLSRQEFNDSLAGFVSFGDAHPFKPEEDKTIACIGHQVNPAKGQFRFAFASPRMLNLLLALQDFAGAVKADVRLLHKVPHPFVGAFDSLAALMMKKWTHLGETPLVEYFKTLWLTERKMWGRAHVEPGDPSTNNGQERKHRVLKDLQDHKRLPLAQLHRAADGRAAQANRGSGYFSQEGQRVGHHSKDVERCPGE